MIIDLIFIAIGAISIFFSGALIGLYECMIFFDTVDDWLGPNWAYSFFTADKDRNKDGEIDYWEKTFPDDYGHRAKRYAMCFRIFGILLIAYGIYPVLETFEYIMPIKVSSFISSMILTLMVFIWESAGFLLTFNRYRKPKKQH